MGTRRRLGAIALCAVAGALLTGCEIKQELGATCSTSPPVPHHNYGVVSVDIEVPPRVRAGSTFTVRVDHIGASITPESPPNLPAGTISVTGGATPSGNFGVGYPSGGDPAFPVTLSFTATGAPGETVVVRAESGSGVLGTYPQAILLTCYPDAVLATIPITSPDGSPPA
jgi:hypothetical protein